jgi:precorrin-6B methylase 2
MQSILSAAIRSLFRYGTRMFDWFVLISVAAIILVVVATTIAHIQTETPFVGTPKRVCEAMIRLARLKGDEMVCDIGAGDARLLIAASRKAPGIRAVGFENALAVWLMGQARILFTRAPVSLRFRDARYIDLSQSDVIFLYLNSAMMKEMEEKFAKELKPGTRIISHAFHLPNKTPILEEHIPLRRRAARILVYEW